LELLLAEEQLLSDSKNECAPAVDTIQHLVGKLHFRFLLGIL